MEIQQKIQTVYRTRWITRKIDLMYTTEFGAQNATQFWVGGLNAERLFIFLNLMKHRSILRVKHPHHLPRKKNKNR